MNKFIINLLETKSENEIYLRRYISFIDFFIGRKIDKNIKYEKHHILPKAKDLFPEYKSLNDFTWNLVYLTPREHFIAHRMLAKIFKKSQIVALKRMYESSQNGGKLNSRQYEELKNNFAKHISEKLTGLKRSDEMCKKMSIIKTEFYKNKENRKKQSIACSKPKSQSGKKNISEANKKRIGWKHTSENIEKIRQSSLNRRHSDTTKELLKRINLGKIVSKDTREKMSKAIKNSPKCECQHCGKILDIRNYSRWHGNNCKFKEING